MNETSHIDDKEACSAAVKPQSVVRSLFNRSIRESRIPLLLSLMVISLGFWIVCAKLVVPPVIESAYRGESWLVGPAFFVPHGGRVSGIIRP
jgi:hypothetical protein